MSASCKYNGPPWQGHSRLMRSGWDQIDIIDSRLLAWNELPLS